MACVNQNTANGQSKAVDALKDKVICEYKELLKYLERGHRYDYQLILEEISLIELLEENEVNRSEFVEQFYLNNKWQITLFKHQVVLEMNVSILLTNKLILHNF